MLPKILKSGLVSSVASLTSWGEGASLALVGDPSSDGVTIKMPYGVDVLHLAFSDLTCHLEDMGIGVFWLHCAA